MPATTLTPAALDQAAARLAPGPALAPAEVEAWRDIIGKYERTAPASPAARDLLNGKTVDDLINEAGINAPGQRPAMEIRLPGRLGRALPDWTHLRRRDLSLPASTQLYAAAVILERWGFQAEPHRLRNRLGRRCVCGAIVVAVCLGIGSEFRAEQAAWHVLCVLREQHRWPHLIGDWAQVPGRTPQQAIDLLHTAHRRALNAGQ